MTRFGPMTALEDSLRMTRAVPNALPVPRRYPRPVWLAILSCRLLSRYRDFRRTGVTEPAASLDLRRLFRLTNGRFNDAVALVNGLVHPARRLPANSGVLGDLDHAAIARFRDELRAEGLCRLPARLPAELCERLRRLALELPCRVKPPLPDGPELVRFDPEHVMATQYKADRQALHEHPDIQRLATDLSLLAVAQAYLGCRPVFMGCSMWWTTAFSDQPLSDAAQLFHFDMSQIKFLKFFVYLTDVVADNGAHVFVRGSHRRLPRPLLEDRRFGDDEVLAHYDADRVETLTGEPGTIFAEDTRGLHKGTPVRRGQRLILQCLYATSAFGQPVDPVEVNERFDPSFVDAIERMPETFCRFSRA